MKFFLRLFFIIIFFSCSKKENEDLKELLYNLKFDISGNGTIDKESGEYNLSDSFTVTAIPEEGNYFDHWEGDIISEENPLIFDLNKDINLIAVFKPYPIVSTEIIKYDPKKIDNNSIFIIENGATTAYLIDKEGNRIKTWNFESKLGNDLELLSDGSVMGIFKPDETFFNFGGFGGVLKKYNINGDLTWEYSINSENELMHHDFTILPNGNVLTLVWERILLKDALDNGIKRESDLFAEKIVEINPITNEIVWQWRSWEHKVQDQDINLPNYGSVSSQFGKIDFNYYPKENGDIMHANGIYYDSNNDLIYLSVNYYSEVWVIDHSVSNENSSSSLGDLKYRFGNPSAYKADGERLFFNNHHPNLVELDPITKGNFIIFMNGYEDEQSIVYELKLPYNSFDDNDTLIPPDILWSFTSPDLFHGKISGALRLSNGNTLICEGDFGYWEVTNEGEVVWLYDGGGETFWRGYSITNEVKDLFIGNN